MRGRGTGARQAAERSAALLAEAGLAPTAERRRHGPVVRRSHAAVDGGEMPAAALVWQGLDTTAIMLARGSISPAMKRAGDLFHDHFRRAALDGLWSADPTRVPVKLSGAAASRWEQRGGSAAARLQILAALDVLGGASAPGGSCAWCVLGCEMSLKRWALTANWTNRRIVHEVASGILIADLGILKQHWGL